MAFTDFPEATQGIELLQRALTRGRLGHAYLFSGGQIETLEALAKNLAKTLNCKNPKRTEGTAIDCCDECLSCQKVDHETHGDVFWLRPESKSRQIEIHFITHRPKSPPRVLLDAIHMKPNESEFKIAIISGADRMTVQAANSFLKTLEEPPPKSVMILLTTEPGRILETIVSRCLRLNFAGDGSKRWTAEQIEWLTGFSALASAEQRSLLGRYRLMDVLAQKLAALRETVDAELTARSPLEKYDDLEKDLRERWEDELKAAIEAEYRRRRADVLSLVQWWLRDVWLQSLEAGREFLSFPEIGGADKVAARIGTVRAGENLRTLEKMQRLLFTNVQEALALEVGLLKLNL